jgi:hypothetical protein
MAQYSPPGLGGSATRAFNMAKSLLLNGCKVTVVAAVPHYSHGKIPKGCRWKPLKVATGKNEGSENIHNSSRIKRFLHLEVAI